jgi:transcriptional regulator with XRE-family HTH domain
MKYGHNLRKVRMLKNYSTKYMYMGLKMSQSNYNKVESNEIDLSDERLEQAAELLGVTPEFIRNFKEDAIFEHSNYNNKQEENANDVAQKNQEEMFNLLKETIQMLKDQLAFMQKQHEYLVEQLAQR